MRTQRCYGFTLTELLVVIALIAALLAIALPVLIQARGKARQTTCASNLRQLCMGALMYAQDNEGRFPPFSNTAPGIDCDTAYPPSGWRSDMAPFCAPELLHASLFPYVRSKGGIWFCPSDPFAGRPSTVWLTDHRFSSYVFRFTRNWVVSPDGFRQVSPDGSSRELDATRTRLVHDPLWGVGHQGDHYDHSGGVNICYVDGHVKLYIMGGRSR